MGVEPYNTRKIQLVLKETNMNQYLNSELATVKAKKRGEDEFLQAVEEVLESLSPVLERHPE